jgi:nucleotide-binding universal stress UspA family protein
MKTVIVPIDFSDTSLNAAEYAVRFLSGHNSVEIILYHCYDTEFGEDNSLENLGNLRKRLLEIASLDIVLLAEKGEDFLEELEKLARHRQADLVIMGITGGRSRREQRFMGSNTLKLAENKYIPVLIVPENCKYMGMKNVLLATDLKDVVGTIPSEPIKKILKEFNLSLHVINVNEEHYIALTEEHEAEKRKIANMFSDFNPEFYFLRLFDVEEAINQFAEDKNIDLIINVHREHSLINKIFKESHTKKLAFQSQVPLLVVHE